MLTSHATSGLLRQGFAVGADPALRKNHHTAACAECSLQMTHAEGRLRIKRDNLSEAKDGQRPQPATGDT